MARENAAANGIANATYHAAKAESLVWETEKPDTVIIDPPRAGLHPKVIKTLLEKRPERIVYVSCNPTTLAPNAAQLVEAGWTLKHVRPVDMFPQTPHIECVALLERA